MRLLRRLLVFALLWIGAALPAQAAVTITFWSHEFGNSFPHAFLTLRGIPDAGGAPIDRNFGFTAKAVTPALLFGPVGGKLDIAKPAYIADSTAQFAMVMTDAQYAAVVALAQAWDAKGSESTYSLKSHNCVHFVKEAARLMGLVGLDQPQLMKRPRSYLHAVAAANPDRITVIDEAGAAYLAGLAPLASPVAPPVPGAPLPAPIPAPTTPSVSAPAEPALRPAPAR